MEDILNKNELIIYWCYTTNNVDIFNSEKPENLFSSLSQNKNKKSKDTSFFACPSVSERMKSTFVFKSPDDIKFIYDFENEDVPLIHSLSNIQANVFKKSNLNKNGYTEIKLRWAFFCEEDLEVFINPPSMHRPTDFYKKAFIPIGKLNIGKWFRPLPLELELWDKKNQIHIKKGDPLFYLEALTNKTIIFRQFEINNEILDIMGFCTKSPDRDGRNLTLLQRYDIFKLNNKKNMLIKLIKEMVIKE
jgi:hypothetical protein